MISFQKSWESIQEKLLFRRIKGQFDDIATHETIAETSNEASNTAALSINVYEFQNSKSTDLREDNRVSDSPLQDESSSIIATDRLSKLIFSLYNDNRCDNEDETNISPAEAPFEDHDEMNDHVTSGLIDAPSKFSEMNYDQEATLHETMVLENDVVEKDVEESSPCEV
jgi:hypothetical protein